MDTDVTAWNREFRSRKDLPILWLVPLLFFLGAAFLSYRMQGGSFHGPERTGRSGAVQSALLRYQISQRSYLSFGFRNLLADLAWLEAVQVSGAKVLSREDYDRLFLLLQTVANYDPKFAVPYLLGGLALGDSADHLREALDLLSRGKKSLPEDWRFPFYIGYLHYFGGGDPLSGGRALEEASGVPGSPPYLPLLASRMLTEGREPETALSFLTTTLEHEADPGRKKIIEKRIRDVTVERDVQILERAVEAYRGLHGRLPGSLPDLVRSGAIRRIPVEPNGGSYVMTPEGHVRSTRAPTRMKVFRKG